MRSKTNHKWVKWIVIALIAVAFTNLGFDLAPYWQAWQKSTHYVQKEMRPASQLGGLSDKSKKQLASLDYQPGQGVIIYVNNDKSSLNVKAWRENQVNYAQLDRLGRNSAGNTAFLENRNHADNHFRLTQNIDPSGWHPNNDGQLIYNRGHLIAYSLTAGIDPQTGRYHHGVVGDQNNPRNLFTETDFINQEVQTIYESKVRHAIEQHKRVIYQVTPIFRGNETMARGVNLQAISTDGQVNFNVYLFNVEPGVRINYQTGAYVLDPRMVIPVPYGAQRASDNTDGLGEFQYYGDYQRPDANSPRHYQRTW